MGAACCRDPGDNSVAERIPTPRGDAAQLCEAAGSGDLSVVRGLIAQGFSVNDADPVSTPRSRNITPLIAAARAGHKDIVRLLLAEPTVDVNATTNNDVITSRSLQNALHWACREGHADAVEELLSCPDLNVNAGTKLGYTALQIACQVGHCQVVQLLVADPRVDIKFYWKSPSNVEMDAVKVAIYEAFADVVKILVNTGRRDGPDINALSQSPECRMTHIGQAATNGHPAIVRVLVEARANPDIPNDKGKDTLAIAADADNTEIVMILLSKGSSGSSTFSAFREAQILGHGPGLRKLYQEGKHLQPNEKLPALHKAVLENDLKALKEALQEFKAAGHFASVVVDGGGFPAAYWAVEFGQWDQVKELLHDGHSMADDFVEKLLSGGFGKIPKEPSEKAGSRVFDVFRALLAEEAGITKDKQKAKGAFKLLHPFCASVPALRFFEENIDDFVWLRETCKEQSDKIYGRIDAEVGRESLRELSEVGKDEPHEGLRQDDEGLLPKFDYIANTTTGQKMAGNHELFAARSIALAATGIQSVFMDDIRALLTADFPDATLHEAPPKTYSRMYNKLQNKEEHGDPTIPKPRPMKNVDVNRLGVSVEKPEDVEKIFMAIKSRYKIRRVKNTHHPDGDGWGAYRSVLVNFEYDPDLTLHELFGSSPGYMDRAVNNKEGADDIEESYVADDATAKKWLAYCKQQKPVFDWLWGLQGLWYAAREEPDRKFRIAAEVQIVLKAYMRGRELSHLLYKISRCETGPSEMARDFAGSFQEETAQLKEAKATVQQIAREARQTRAKGA